MLGPLQQCKIDECLVHLLGNCWDQLELLRPASFPDATAEHQCAVSAEVSKDPSGLQS